MAAPLWDQNKHSDSSASSADVIKKSPSITSLTKEPVTKVGASLPD